MKKFSDFAEETISLEGDKVRIGELFNRQIILLSYRLMQSKVPNLTDKACLQIQFQYEDDSTKYVAFTNSLVLIKQIQQYEKELPFLTKIQKRGNYYTFT